MRRMGPPAIIELQLPPSGHRSCRVSCSCPWDRTAPQAASAFLPVFTSSFSLLPLLLSLAFVFGSFVHCPYCAFVPRKKEESKRSDDSRSLVLSRRFFFLNKQSICLLDSHPRRKKKKVIGRNPQLVQEKVRWLVDIGSFLSRVPVAEENGVTEAEDAVGHSPFCVPFSTVSRLESHCDQVHPASSDCPLFHGPLEIGPESRRLWQISREPAWRLGLAQATSAEKKTCVLFLPHHGIFFFTFPPFRRGPV